MISKTKGCGGELSVETLARMAGMLRLLAHPHRLKVIEILEQRKDGAPVYEIAERLNLPPAATSQHLNHMRRVGLVEAERDGRAVRYRIADSRCFVQMQTLLGGRRMVDWLSGEQLPRIC